MHWIKASAKYVNVYIFYMLLGEQKIECESNILNKKEKEIVVFIF